MRVDEAGERRLADALRPDQKKRLLEVCEPRDVFEQFPDNIALTDEICIDHDLLHIVSVLILVSYSSYVPVVFCRVKKRSEHEVVELVSPACNLFRRLRNCSFVVAPGGGKHKS